MIPEIMATIGFLSCAWLGVVDNNVYLSVIVIYLLVSSALRHGVDRELIALPLLIPATFMIYHVGAIFRFQDQYADEVVKNAIALIFVALISFSIGAKAFGNRRAAESAVAKGGGGIDIGIFRQANLLLWVLSFVSLCSFASAFKSIGEFVSIGYGTELFRRMESAQLFGNGLTWIPVALINQAIIDHAGKHRIRSFAALSGLAAVILILLKIGARGTVIYLFLYATVLVDLMVAKLNRKVVFTLFLGLFIFGVSFSYARYYIAEGLSTALYKGLATVLRYPETLLDLSKTNEFSWPAASLLEVLASKNPNLPLLGESYFFAAIGVLPGAVDALGGYTQPSIQRMRVFHPAEFASGTGYGYSPIAEAMVNYGTIGVICVFFLMGILTSHVDRKARQGNTAAILAYAGMFPVFLFDWMRIDAMSYMYKFYRGFGITFILYLLIRAFSAPRGNNDEL